MQQTKVQVLQQNGQAALIALLVLTIATTVGLSLMARGTTDVSVTRNIEESTRAFSAAEAGIEESLKSGVASAGTIDQSLGITYNVQVAPIVAAANTPFLFSQKTLNENDETVWLVNHNDDGTLSEVPTYTAPSIGVCWSTEETIPAVVVSIVYKESSNGTYRVAKAAYDPVGARAAVDNFSAPTALTGGCGATTNTTYLSTIQFSDFVPVIDPTHDTLIAIRIRPVYSGALIGILPSQDLPTQGKRIVSTGQTLSGTNRKILVSQQYRSPGSIFDHAVYTEGSFAH